MRRSPAQIASGLVLPMALAAAALGATGVLGWLIEAPALLRIIPGRPLMQPNTAVALIVCACGVIAAATGRGGVRKTLRMVAALLVGAVGALTLAEYAFGADLIIDRLLPSVAESLPFPGRPSPLTALAFVCLGGALAAIDVETRKGGRPAEWLAGTAALLALVTLTGHAAGSGALYQLTRSAAVRGMALHSAVALGLLSLAVLCARPTRGLMRLVTSQGMGGTLARRLVVPVVLMPPALNLLLWLVRRAGLQDLPLAFALLAVSTVPFMLALALQTAFSVERAEERLRHAEESFRTLVDHAPDGIFIATLDGVYTEVNPCGARLLGYTPEELVGMRIVDLIRPEDALRLENNRLRLADPAVTLQQDWPLKHKQGHYMPFEVSTCILADGRWVAFVRDQRARKLAEQRLQEAHEAEQRARAQLESLAGATTAVSEAVAALPETDLRTVLQTIVLQAQLLTDARYGALGVGFDPEVPFETWVFGGMSEEVARRLGRPPRPIGALGEVARHGRTLRVRDVTTLEAFGGLPEGHPVIGSFLGVPIRYRGRTVGNLYLANKQGAAEFSSDDERLAEALASRAATAIETVRLYRAEAIGRRWLRSVVDEIPEAVVITDSLGRITMMNTAARAFAIGRDTPDPFGNLVGFEVRTASCEPVPPEDQPLARALAGDLVREELRIRDAAGAWLSVLASGAVVRSVEGNQGAVVILQDVTALRELQRLRDEWTSIVAHDLRQPIQLIGLSAQMLAGEPGSLSETQAKTLRRIAGAAERIQQMIGDLLDVSRIETRQLALKLERLDIVEWTHEAVVRAGLVLGGRPVRVEVIGALPAVCADPARLEQILANLLSNAAKYGEPGSEVVVTLAARDREVELAVTNRGEGISPEDQALLFTRFYRTRRARAGSREGLGVGLYITKGLVEAHGGRIAVESTPGVTTTFRFTLPAEARPGAVEQPPAVH